VSVTAIRCGGEGKCRRYGIFATDVVVVVMWYGGGGAAWWRCENER
jgi:hypothetical protein